MQTLHQVKSHHATENPKRADGPLIILNGNLALTVAVAKVSGVKVRRHVGPAKVFDSEEDAIQAV